MRIYIVTQVDWSNSEFLTSVHYSEEEVVKLLWKLKRQAEDDGITGLTVDEILLRIYSEKFEVATKEVFLP